MDGLVWGRASRCWALRLSQLSAWAVGVWALRAGREGRREGCLINRLGQTLWPPDHHISPSFLSGFKLKGNRCFSVVGFGVEWKWACSTGKWTFSWILYLWFLKIEFSVNSPPPPEFGQMYHLAGLKSIKKELWEPVGGDSRALALYLAHPSLVPSISSDPSEHYQEYFWGTEEGIPLSIARCGTET